MKDYANFLEQMQQSYEQLAGMRADDASDVGIRFKILAVQFASVTVIGLKCAWRLAFFVLTL